MGRWCHLLVDPYGCDAGTGTLWCQKTDKIRRVCSLQGRNTAAAATYWARGQPADFVKRRSEHNTLILGLVVLHALDWYAEQGEHYDEVVLLQATTPLTSLQDVLGCLRLFRTLDGAPVVAVAEPRTPIDFHFRMDGSRLLPATEAAFVDTRQNRPPEAALATSVYICTPAWLRERDHWVVPGETHGFMVPSQHAFEIDDESGLVVNQALSDHVSPWPADRIMVIAEAGINHNGDLKLALEMIDTAAQCGADAVNSIVA